MNDHYSEHAEADWDRYKRAKEASETDKKVHVLDGIAQYVATVAIRGLGETGEPSNGDILAALELLEIAFRARNLDANLVVNAITQAIADTVRDIERMG